ncbi:hypothetical protein [Dysosmobacter sp.]|uniref:hypothetical protein n=1 Tax=Dysosmobacter sp. TaxID=2591382 RepID=UPI002A8A5531|nr:hypothetical protein [Dysosmobacter sp.]MDY3280972.1 hypothetical protein [Dysosmobacter sp.]
MSQWDEFDCTLASSLSQLPPPDEGMDAVTPWRRAMKQIVTGLCLTCFTLNFLGLQYLLPALGAMELYLGARSLRDANRWFRRFFIISACKGIFLYINLAAAATTFHASLALFNTVSGIPLTAALLVCFRQGLRQITRETAPDFRKDPALWALAWYAVLILLALFLPQPGWPVFLLLIFAFYRIVRALLSAAAELETAGYALRAAPVRISGERLRAVCLGSLLALVGLAMVLWGHTPLSGTAVTEVPLSPEGRAVQEELAELGFGSVWAQQLTETDLLSLRGAVRLDDGGVEEIPQGSDGGNLHENQVFFFLMPDGDVRVLHFFAPGDGGGFWQCQLSVRSNAAVTGCTTRLTWQRGGRFRAAELAAEDGVMNTGLDFFGQPYTECSAEFPPFSWPLFSHTRRGYVLFTAGQEANPRTLLQERLEYRSDSHPAYPYGTYAGKADWSYGRRCYYGDGSGLTWKADQETE